MAEYIIDKIAYNGDVYKLQDNQSGYITTETDPVFSASAAAGISATDISNWNGKSDTDEKVKTTFTHSGNYYLTGAQSAISPTTGGLAASTHVMVSLDSTYVTLQLDGDDYNPLRGRIQLRSSTGKHMYIQSEALTSTRNVNFPDKTGTIALTSDVPSISLNGSSTTSASFYAPTTAGTSGQVLTSNGSGAPTWATIPAGVTVTLNGSTTTTPSFYAPTSAGTSGQVLTSNGSGAPTWAAAPSGGGDIFIATYDVTTIEQVRAAYQAGKYIICRSPSDFSALGWYSLAEREIVYDVDQTTILGETYFFRYVSGYSGSNTSRVELWYIALDKDGGWYYNNTNLNIPKITLNGSTTTSPNFYAPTTAGTSGQVLTSNGSGAPTWAPATGGTDEKLALSEVTAGTTYYPIMGTGTTAATRQYDTGGLSYINDGGMKRLSIGDNTSNNNLGMLDIYSLTSSRVRLAASTSLGSNVLVYLPSTAGTIALTSDITKAQIIRWTES